MIQTFTPNDVLKNQSGELSREESVLLQTLMSEQSELGEFAQTLELLEEQMPKLIHNPGEPLVQRIMVNLRLEALKS